MNFFNIEIPDWLIVVNTLLLFGYLFYRKHAEKRIAELKASGSAGQQVQVNLTNLVSIWVQNEIDKLIKEGKTEEEAKQIVMEKYKFLFMLAQASDALGISNYVVKKLLKWLR